MNQQSSHLMHPAVSLLKRGLVVGLLLVSAHCGGTKTKTTNVWLNQAYVAGPPKSVAVFGTNLDEGGRRSLEDAFVAALRARGVRAEAAYVLFPGELPPTDVAKEGVLARGFDAILVSRLRHVKDKVSYVSDGSGTTWNGYYGSTRGGTYAVNETYVRFDTTYWDPKSGQLIWAAHTETANPSSGKDFVKSLTKEVMHRMETVHLVAGGPKEK